MEYQTRIINLDRDADRSIAETILKNAPRGIQVVFREKQAKRTLQQNKFMWSGMISDFAEQGWLLGRKFSAAVWHEYLKRNYLPDHEEEGITKSGYKKWDVLPSGDLILVGSTTDLLTRGMSEYLERCYAFGAEELGIRFTASPRDY